MLKSNAYNISSQIPHYGFYHNISKQDSGQGENSVDVPLVIPARKFKKADRVQSCHWNSQAMILSKFFEYCLGNFIGICLHGLLRCR